MNCMPNPPATRSQRLGEKTHSGMSRIPRTAAQIIDRCLSRAQPGAIILMHVGIESEDGPALRTLIGGLRERGYQFVNITDLLGL